MPAVPSGAKSGSASSGRSVLGQYGLDRDTMDTDAKNSCQTYGISSSVFRASVFSPYSPTCHFGVKRKELRMRSGRVAGEVTAFLGTLCVDVFLPITHLSQMCATYEVYPPNNNLLFQRICNRLYVFLVNHSR